MKAKGIAVDVVCTHTSPKFCEPNIINGLNEWSMRDATLKQEEESERLLMSRLYQRLIADGHPLRHWIYGHYHHLAVINDIRFVLLDRQRDGVCDIEEIV